MQNLPKNKRQLIFIALVGTLCGVHTLSAQQNARAIIDTLRWGFDYRSAEAYRRANQAKHLDSTYYVSHMIEAFHYYDKAEELTGLARAVEPLRKTVKLFENDYRYCINQRYSVEEVRSGAWRELLRQIDYLIISGTLTECYLSLEQPDSAYKALMHLKNADLAFDFRSYQGLAWLYFRSRIYDSKKYPFLKDTIEDNLRTAFAYTDSLEMKYQKNEPYLRNKILLAYGPGSPFYAFFENAYLDQPQGFVANTRGILYGYNFQPQLAISYFNKMRSDQSLAKTVNLGYTYLSAIDFRKSEQYFADTPDYGSKSRGGHWQGYSTIFVYKGKPLEGALKLREDRDKHGFTIGYGWDNLCLARMYLYSGLIKECQLSLNKADKFSEVHFNTSFREDQYRFMLKALRYMQNEYEIKALRFENKNRWFTFEWWKELPQLLYLKYTNLYQLANELAKNPERDIVYYHIFHTESIISFDELWNIIKHYSRKFFLKTFARLRQSDPRDNLRRYYDYFIGKLRLQDGDLDAAYDQFNRILNDPGLDEEYERLLIARVHESCALISQEKGWTPQKVYHLQRFYETYPQLVPFSEVRMSFQLTLSDELKASQRPGVKKTLQQLRDCNIDWDPPKNEAYPEVRLSLGENRQIQYQVLVNRDLFTEGSVDISHGDAGRQLAYRLFKIMR